MCSSAVIELLQLCQVRPFWVINERKKDADYIFIRQCCHLSLQYNEDDMNILGRSYSLKKNRIISFIEMYRFKHFDFCQKWRQISDSVINKIWTFLWKEKKREVWKTLFNLFWVWMFYLTWNILTKNQMKVFNKSFSLQAYIIPKIPLLWKIYLMFILRKSVNWRP